MAAFVAAGPSNLDTPRSPVSISTDSSRRGSLRQAPSEKTSEPPTPISPTTRLIRRRAASLNTEAANDPRIGDLALNSARSNGPPSSDLTREQVCLCQPEPKIPRPRNAFILYRQAYQAQVVAQNPGLANPEISKIIGEQWREQDPDVKSDWKRLAEEEKQRHQHQYPNYRYQPRRAGRPNVLRPMTASATDDQIRCPKCHGRYIITPNTPLTPFTPSFTTEARSEHPLSSIPTSHTTELERPLYSSQMRMDTPRPLPHQMGGQQNQQAQRRTQYAPSHSLSTHRERDEEMDLLSPSPGLKRRRFNEDNNQRGYAANSPISYSGGAPQYRGGPPQQQQQQPMSAGGYKAHFQQSMLQRPGSMGPPPHQHQSPINQQIRHQYPSRSNTFDESLRLPPLQTNQSVASGSVSSGRQDARMEAREMQARSVEAMVMTIPYINKIKVLHKISPPLQPPGPTSPAQDIRGAIVVVEGPEKALLADVGQFILEYLVNDKDKSFAVRSWDSVTPGSKKSSISVPADTEMSDGAAATSPVALGKLNSSMEEGDPIVDYLSIISDWHNKSKEIATYITSTAPTPPPPSNPPSSTGTEPVTSGSQTDKKILPIALVPHGFSLSTSDTFALRTPINDAYAPVDHWQWMATLWRGIVGPDLTVYVARCGREEMQRCESVEIRKDCDAIVVRVPQEGGKGLDEKTARRLGFEVVEFVRNGESGFGRG